MQAPPVQYCTTSDGVSIAYTVSGSGPPLLFATEPVVSHTQLEWSQPVFGALMRRLAERTTLIRYDRRGTGLSDRHNLIDPLDTFTTDIEAVVARVGLSRFALAGVQTASFGVINYAAQHPERISRLILADGLIRVTDMLATQQGKALLAVLAADYMLGTEAIGAAAFGVGRDENRDYGAYIRQCIGPDYFGGLGNGADVNVGDALSLITQPTLVLKHAGVLYIPMDTAKELASRIPHAQLAVVEGGWADDIVGFGDRIADFVLQDAAPIDVKTTSTAASGVRTGVQTILFTDIEGHTQMMQRLGDDAGRALLREHERITRDVITKHGGAEIKTIGDAFMVSFGSVAAAAQCAVDLQQAITTAPTTEALKIRIGLNAGEPIAEEGDLFGSSVILASRIVAQANGGEILVSDTVRGLLAGKPFLFNDRGDTALRGFEDPVRLYELRWSRTHDATASNLCDTTPHDGSGYPFLHDFRRRPHRLHGARRGLSAALHARLGQSSRILPVAGRNPRADATAMPVISRSSCTTSGAQDSPTAASRTTRRRLALATLRASSAT